MPKNTSHPRRWLDGRAVEVRVVGGTRCKGPVTQNQSGRSARSLSVQQHGSVSLSQSKSEITSQHTSRAQNARSLLPCPYKEAVQWNSATVIMERCSSNLHPAQSPGWKACSRCSTKVLRSGWPIQPPPYWVGIYNLIKTVRAGAL